MFTRHSTEESSAKRPETTGRLLAVGDIHGCLRHLERLMSRVQPILEDQIVFLGDYIDRGPDSRGVLEYLIDFGRRFPRTVFLKGNHEEMFLDFIAGRNQMLYILNGGESTLANYQEGEKLRIPTAHLDFFKNLRLFFETDQYIFVHAGLRPGLPLHTQNEKDLLWIREEFLHSDYDWGKTVVYGHTPSLNTVMAPGRIGVDTGAVYGRVLSCCDVVKRTCWNA